MNNTELYLCCNIIVMTIVDCCLLLFSLLQPGAFNIKLIIVATDTRLSSFMTA